MPAECTRGKGSDGKGRVVAVFISQTPAAFRKEEAAGSRGWLQQAKQN